MNREAAPEGLEEEDAPLGELLPRLGTAIPGPISCALAGRLAKVESRNVTFSSREFPVFWTEARGANVRDADGNVYVDLTGAFGVASAGHAHPRIIKAVRGQAARLVHGMGDVHPPLQKVLLLERLCDLAPWPDARGVLASAGSEAVEIALKTAQLATGRSGVIAFEGGYHGLTLGALSATAREDFRAPFRDRLPGGVSFVPFPDPLGEGGEAGSRCLARLDRALAAAEARGDPAACVIVEPIQGRGGVRVPPRGFLGEVARRARGAGALFILDEIFTGFGRTGSLFAFEDEGAVPDLLCLGKALGGGLPISACLGAGPVMDAWPLSRGEALHTSTFLGHPLACASALAFLDVLESEALAARAREEGERFGTGLAAALAGTPGVREVRGRGLLLGVELEEPFAVTGAAFRVAVEALRRGLVVLPAGDRGEVVELSPPLNVAAAQLDWSVEALAGVLRAMGGE